MRASGIGGTTRDLPGHQEIKHAEICGEIDQQLPSGNFDFGFV